MKVFGSRFFGFRLEQMPFVGFTRRGDRDNLIRWSKPGDLVVFLGTKTEETAVEDQGKLLGLVEFEGTAAFAEDLIPPGTPIPTVLTDANGKLRYPFAVPALRAWKFAPTRDIHEVLGRQLSMAARLGVEELAAEEVAAVLSLPKVELILPQSRATIRSNRVGSGRANKLERDALGQPGPPPSEWSTTVSQEDGPTATYLMRFGSTDVWKLGISKNPAARCKALNYGVPVEVLGHEWKVVLTHIWSDGAEAYRMEQELLTRLNSTYCERVRGPQKKIEAAWASYVAGR